MYTNKSCQIQQGITFLRLADLCVWVGFRSNSVVLISFARSFSYSFVARMLRTPCVVLRCFNISNSLHIESTTDIWGASTFSKHSPVEHLNVVLAGLTDLSITGVSSEAWILLECTMAFSKLVERVHRILRFVYILDFCVFAWPLHTKEYL